MEGMAKFLLIFAYTCFCTNRFLMGMTHAIWMAGYEHQNTQSDDCLLMHFFSARCPPGLSVSQSERATGKLPLKGDLLVSRKVNRLS